MADSVPLIDAAIYGRLGTAIYTYQLGGTAGTATYSGTIGVYNTLAPQQSAPPYIIFQQMTGVDQYGFANSNFESHDYMLKVISQSSYPSQQANPIYDQAHSLLQDAPLTVSGYHPMRVRRSSRLRYPDTQKFWHVGGLYTVDISNP